MQRAVMYGTKLQKWEQITTRHELLIAQRKLWCMVQSYKNESKSQPARPEWFHPCRCDVWYKVTKMRANHNRDIVYICPYKAVMYGTKLQKWEQITTESRHTMNWSRLWCMVQSYKNESKSQRDAFQYVRSRCCDVWYKVTKMRANHNRKSSYHELE